MADEKLGTLFVEVRSDVKALRKDMNVLRTSMDRQTKGIGKTAEKNMIPSWLKIGAVILAARKAWNFATEAKNAARDAEETRNKFEVVFSSMRKEAVQTAKEFAKSFGVASSTAQELLGNTGDLLVGFGFAEDAALDLSSQVNSLAQDLASFTNFSGGAAGASSALTKAILGETESAKSLGIVIRQNTKEFRSEVDATRKAQGLTEQQAKAIVILKQAYEQSGKAIGDYARTKDSLANVERRANEQYKEMQEELGKGLIPAFLALTKAGMGWLTIIKKILGIQKEYNTSILQHDEFLKGLIGTTKAYRNVELNELQIQLAKTMGDIGQLKIVLAQRDASQGGFLFELFGDSAEMRAKINMLEELSTALKSQIGIIQNFDAELAKLGKGGGGGGEETLGLIAAIEAKLEKLEELKPTLFDKDKIAEVNQEIEILRQKLADFDQLGVFKVDAIDITEDLEMLQALIDEQGQGSKVISGGLGEAGEEFADDMLTSLSAGQQLASTVQSGLFAAGQSFVDHMRDALSVISQVLGIVKGFTPAGIVESVVEGAASGGGGVSSVPKAVTSSGGGGGVGSSAALNQINSSIQAMNLNLISKDMRPVNVINIDADSLVEGGLKPAENRLARAGVNTNDI